jgi:hypothetical protein
MNLQFEVQSCELITLYKLFHYKVFTLVLCCKQDRTPISTYKTTATLNAWFID